jgi:hypothetical protein
MKRTGVFLTGDELARARRGADAAGNAPVIRVGDVDLSETAWRCLKWTVYHMALKHGLPSIEGFYGLDFDSGELIAPMSAQHPWS